MELFQGNALPRKIFSKAWLLEQQCGVVRPRRGESERDTDMLVATKPGSRGFLMYDDNSNNIYLQTHLIDKSFANNYLVNDIN